MSALRRVKPPPAPPRTPERQKLADAIKRLAAAVAAADRVGQAQQKLDDRLFSQLQPAVSKAKKLLDQAREVAPEQLVESVLAGEMSGSRTAAEAEAEARLRQAEVAVSEASQARRLLRQESERVAVAVGQARADVGAAVRAVIETDPGQAALVEEFNRCARRALHCAQRLKQLNINPLVEAHGLRLVVQVAPVPTGQTTFRPDPEFASAIAALADDADARLPAMPPEDGPAGDAAEAA